MPLFDKKKLAKIQAEDVVRKDHTILIVDDELHIRIVLSQMLEKHYNVLVAGDGEEALELVQNHPTPEQIRLILCDQRMPRMNGVEFLKKTLPIIPNAIRIIVTAYTDVESIIASVNQAQIYKFIVKPFDKDDLLLTIQRALEAFDLKERNVQLIDELKAINADLEDQVAKRTEELRRERDRAEMYFDFAAVIMLAIDANQNVAHINRKGCEILGYAKDEIIGRNWFDHFLPADIRVKVKTVFGELIKGDIEPVEYFENTVLTRGGEERLIAWHNTILRNENGEITGTLSSGEDITERRLADKAIQESEIRYRTLIKNAPLGIGMATLEGEIITANDQICKMFALPMAKLKQSNLRNSYRYPEQRDVLLEHIRRDGYVRDFEAEMIRSDGSTFHASITVSRITFDGEPRLLTLVIDSTERIQAQEEMMKLKAVFDNANFGAAIADTDGNISYINECFADSHGYRPDELIGQNLSIFHKEEQMEQVTKSIRKLLNTGQVSAEEVWHTHRNGMVFPMLMNGIIIKDQKGRPAFMAATAIDITERRLAQEQLREYSERLEEMVEERTRELEKTQEELLIKERLAVLGHFAGSISHELRNPLATIDTSVYFLKMKMGTGEEKIRQHLERISSNVRKSTAIIQSLLNLSQMEKPRTEKINLTDLISETLDSAKIPDTVKVVLNLSDKRIFVDVETEQMRMALKNVIKNAVQAMNDTGKLTLTAQPAESGQIELSVADTGPGIPPEHLEKVFEPLFSTKTHGIGFGLSITKMIVENHGGSIRAESDPGTGATFTITLPMAEKKEQGLENSA
ncbi:PAS domain S-box protein [Desulfobacterales bacterium HSG2]|nr:PAS domain S-box protein [Desulfobacterales bacterium HSG2]